MQKDEKVLPIFRIIPIINAEPNLDPGTTPTLFFVFYQITS